MKNWLTNVDATWKKDPKDTTRLHSKICRLCGKEQTANFFRGQHTLLTFRLFRLLQKCELGLKILGIKKFL